MCLPHNSVGGTPMRQRSSTSPGVSHFRFHTRSEPTRFRRRSETHQSFVALPVFWFSRGTAIGARQLVSQKGAIGFDLMFDSKRIGVFASRQFVHATRVTAN